MGETLAQGQEQRLMIWYNPDTENWIMPEYFDISSDQSLPILGSKFILIPKDGFPEGKLETNSTIMTLLAAQ